MNEKNIIEMMTNLVQLDIDAVHAYDQATKEIDDPVIRDRLLKFQDDHRTHIRGLSKLIEKLGGQRPEKSKDFKGFVIEAFAAIRSVNGMEGALKSVKTVETITNRQYGKVISWDVPPEVKELLHTYFSQEKIHLDYIVSNLKAING